MSGSFTADIERFCKKFDVGVKNVVRKIAFETFKRIVLRTPVDTGRARANWAVKIGAPTTFEVEGFDKSGQATLVEVSNGVLAWECTGSIFLTNNTSYIGVLEYGRADGRPGSNQAPQGMVRLTVDEMLAWIQNAGNVKQSISGIKGQTSNV